MRRRGHMALLMMALGSATPAAASPCTERVVMYRDGRMTGTICVEDAGAAGLTLLDLSSEWTPVALAPGPSGDAPAYRATYLALAAGAFDAAGTDGDLAREDRFLEVYGVVPSLEVVAARLADEERHRCHAAVRNAPLAAVSAELHEEDTATARERVRAARALRKSLERTAERRELDGLDELAAVSDHYRKQVVALRSAERRLAAVGAMQAHLVCEGLLEGDQVDRRFGWKTGGALAAYQRRHVLVPHGHLDHDTRETLAVDSRELDVRLALRALRERVVTATGLVEDGSAGTGAALVLGRRLEPLPLDRVAGHDPLEDAAPDRIAAATEAAARALGWTDAPAIEQFLAATDRPQRVAVRLPPPPPYHGPAMDLTVEIDRGDVWYDAKPRGRTIARRPAMILYVIHDGRRTPLVRWPTTIGGWQDEKLAEGVVVKRWKESPAGPRVWRDLYLGPTWLAPETTPDDELVRSAGDKHVLARELFGPSYRSAYGLAMFVHYRADRVKRGIAWTDQGVRTHGSGNVRSIFDGRSHGCHRLVPMQALRLAGFVLQHRPHVALGPEPAYYARVVRHRGRFPVNLTTRGDRFELTPPIPVEVLPGRILSRRKRPPRS